jgi:hypothetical protein
MNIQCKSGEYQMPESVALAYRRVYPSAEIEFAQMLIWLETHQTRRPASPKSAPQFVANWFKKVPRLSPQRDARYQTLAALTGRGNVIDFDTGRSNTQAVSADDGDLWGAEDGGRMDGRGRGRNTANVADDAIEVSTRRIAGGR